MSSSGDLIVQMNEPMSLLRPAGIDTASDLEELDPRLAGVLDDGFAEISECVVLRRFLDTARRTSVSACSDEVGFEAFVNHVHVEDELPGRSAELALAQSVSFARRLDRDLRVTFPDHRFEIIISVSPSPVVRFHGVRPGQRWLAEDIEGYQEPVMSILQAP
jgi:hypothetical protein